VTLTQELTGSSNAAVAEPASVPLSLMSVRTFLFEHGMPIVPWASAEEVLDELHELLRSQQSNDAFWQSLHELMQVLRIDLEALLPNGDKGNEALALVSHQTLLDEIRQGIEGQPVPFQGFVAFARKLSQHGLAVLLLLAGAATVSCGARTEDASEVGSSSGGSGVATAGASSLGGNAGLGGASFVVITSAQGGSTYTANSGTGPCTSVGLTMTDVQSIATQCIQAGPMRDAVLTCISTLNSTWQQGIESVLNCMSCDQAASILVTLANSCSNLPANYQCWLTPCTPVYLGVRMD